MVDGKVKSETKKNDDMFYDIMVAAQALMQLNGENNNIVRKRSEKRISSEEVDQKPNNSSLYASITSTMCRSELRSTCSSITKGTKTLYRVL